jgi:hypothetical protein
MRPAFLLTLATCGFLACLTSCSSDAERDNPNKLDAASDNAELAQLYQQDQAERQVPDIDWTALLKRDGERQDRVGELFAADSLVTANDFYHAAMILQHGADSISYRHAYELAQRSVGLDSTNENARWLTAAARDRYLLSIDEAQWYGTQLLILNGITYLQRIDTTKVTDADRARLGAQTLDEIRASLTEANGEDRGLLQVPDSLKIKVRR